MGTLTGEYLLARASEVVQDDDHITWTSDQFLEWINDAQRATVLVKPDSNVSTGSVQLVAGTLQSISGIRLQSVIRNMGSDGLTPGNAIRLVQRGIKDEADPSWHTDTASLTILEYIYDDRDPKHYYVSPPPDTVAANVYVEISQVVEPTALSAITDTIDLEDIYTPAMLEWILYRAFSREAEEVQDVSRAAAHVERFFALNDKKMNMDMIISPKVRAQLEK